MSDRETQILTELERQANLRVLNEASAQGCRITVDGTTYWNLSSNDYLGLSDPAIQNKFLAAVDLDRFLLSNPSSRLLTGNSPDYTALEALLGSLYGGSALVLGSGYLVNSGVLPAITAADDCILADKLVHASLIDGMRLCHCPWKRYRHNDLDHLEHLLREAAGRRVVVVTESLFSMDGDRAPLEGLARLQAAYGFELYLDEAHAFGVLGPDGLGLAAAYNASAAVPLRVDYLVGTFGKALASQGAFVACSESRKQMLVNRMRTLIFSTALPPLSLQWTRFLVERLPKFGARRARLEELWGLLGGSSHIVPVPVGENARAVSLSRQLREAGYWVSAIRPPTVPEGTARLRISLSAAHSPETIEQFAELCKQLG